MMDEKQGPDSAARPFQLRPSILSGSGFGSSLGGFGSGGGDKSSKEFTLRPSALTTAAGHRDTTTTTTTTTNNNNNNNNTADNTKETRKRLHEDDKPDEDLNKNDGRVGEDSTKKVKTSTDTSTSSTEEPIKLTEDLQKPAGIGTFGFGDEEKTTTNGRKNHNNDTTTTSDAGGQKNFFVFGNNSTAGSVGFNTLKGDEPEPEDGVVTNGGVDESEDATAVVVDAGDKEKLLENADEYQQKNDNKTHLSQVEQVTGEEGERNVLQVFCKLHVFDKARTSWVEKGRGTLRLNDRAQGEGVFQSRLVFRTQGTNIVGLNAMLWPEMCCERVKEKSIRITSLDADTNEARVYLITTSVKDALQTYIAIDRRIVALKRNVEAQEEKKQQQLQKDNPINDTTSSTGSTSGHADDEDSSTESERISSRGESLYGATDDSDRQISTSPEEHHV